MYANPRLRSPIRKSSIADRGQPIRDARRFERVIARHRHEGRGTHLASVRLGASASVAASIGIRHALETEIDMQPLLTKTMILAAVLTFAGTTRAFAQDVMVANVPFAFISSGVTHQPGRYQFRTVNDEHAVEFDEAGHGGCFASVVTRVNALGPHAETVDGRLVFDKVGDIYYLAQMWLPDEDGFQLAVPKGVHLNRDLAQQRVVPLQTLASLR
jgi:hypothetical protein